MPSFLCTYENKWTKVWHWLYNNYFSKIVHYFIRQQMSVLFSPQWFISNTELVPLSVSFTEDASEELVSRLRNHESSTCKLYSLLKYYFMRQKDESWNSFKVNLLWILNTSASLCKRSKTVPRHRSWPVNWKYNIALDIYVFVFIDLFGGEGSKNNNNNKTKTQT